MAGFFKKLLDSFKIFTEDDDLDDEYDDYVLEQEEKGHKRLGRDQEPQPAQPKPRTERRVPAFSQRRTGGIEDYDYDSLPSSSSSGSNKERPVPVKGEKPGGRKIVPISPGKNSEVCIMKPSGFDESRDISDIIRSNRPCIMNLEGLEMDAAQRIMDFVSGSLYVLDGQIHQISESIFIVSPESVDISGDYLNQLKKDKQDKFDVPTFHKGF